MEETSPPWKPPRALPAWGTTFVTREAALGRLSELLARAECRLVTVLGPGGVGKTRLMVEFVRSLPPGEPWAFIELEAFADLEAALVHGLGLGSDRKDDRSARIAAAIGETPLLLVLDNAEHLVAQAGVLVSLLDHCPALRIVVTSRHSLGIAAEWLLPLDGLDHAAAPGEVSPALTLFQTRFEQSGGRPLDQGERELAGEICERLAGVPLALELAAAWGSTLTVEAIRAELERNATGLESPVPAGAVRQQSVRAVFDHTWNLLSPVEREHFVALAVFHDGFEREAAAAVCDVDLAGLAGLRGKSLVQTDHPGRFRLHPLGLEFAREKLEAEPVRREELLDRHAAYYRDHILRAYPDVNGQHQLRAIRHLDAEWANVKAAWSRSMATGAMEGAAECLYLLGLVSFFRARYDEAFEFVSMARQATDSKEAPLLRYVAQTYLAWVQVRWGELETAEQSADAARELLREMDNLTPPLTHLDPALPLATARLAQGDYRAAAELAGTTVQRARRIGDEALETLALYTLENAHWEMANFDESSVALDAAAAISARNGDSWMLAHLQLDLARRAVARGNLDDAEEQLARSIDVRAEFGDAGGLAASRARLGDVLFARREFDRAEQQFIEALRLFRQSADRGGMASSHAALGRIELQRGRQDEARSRFRQALDAAREIGYAHLAADVLVEVAEMSHSTGDAGALSLLAYLAENAATPANVHARVHAIASRVPPAQWNAARRSARSLTQASVLDAAIAALRRPRAVRQPGPQVESLSARELEVLRLVATGASNADIANGLGVKLGTAKWYTSQLYAKLGVANRTEAVARARERDLLP